MTPLAESVIGFAINFAVLFVIVRFIYYPRQRDKNYVFTFFAFNTVVYFVMGLLSSTDIGIGVGFGLFAIFSVLRYRTDTIPIREMTYLFVLIALPVVNSVLLADLMYGEAAVANIAIIGVLLFLETGWGFDYEVRKTVLYERIEMIQPQNWTMLLGDLKDRTGLPIKRIEIGELNFLRDTALIHIFCNARELKAAQVSAISSHTSYHDSE